MKISIAKRLVFASVVFVSASAALAIVVNEEKQKLTASDASEFDLYGRTISISGDVIVVGAVGTVDAVELGRAYIYRLRNTNWIQEQILIASDTEDFDGYGVSVAVDADTAIVGAFRDDCTAGDNCGSVYVFHFNGSLWVEQQKLVASDAATSDFFGISVSLNGDYMIVGAHGADGMPGRPNSGAAYVFWFDGDSWIEQQKISGSDTSGRHAFGTSVSIKGNTLVVGASQSICDAGTLCGSAYVFRYNGTSWIEEQKLTASDADRDRFGISVSLSGDAIAVGAWLAGCVEKDSFVCGAAYVFRYNGASWFEEQILTAFDATAQDRFGRSVAISGNTVVAGAFADDCATGIFCGSAYAYHFDGISWVQMQKLTASDSGRGDDLGYYVALDGITAVAGAIGDDCDKGEQCGSAYVFNVAFTDSNDFTPDSFRIDLQDFATYQAQFNGDLTDYALFQAAFTGP